MEISIAHVNRLVYLPRMVICLNLPTASILPDTFFILSLTRFSFLSSSSGTTLVTFPVKKTPETSFFPPSQSVYRSFHHRRFSLRWKRVELAGKRRPYFFHLTVGFFFILNFNVAVGKSETTTLPLEILQMIGKRLGKGYERVKRC